MRFGSVCSGIEAASMAWEPLGWEAAWFSEIEPFPCAVLKHHYPHVPNHGDMTALPARILAGEVEAPDVLVGGTPCQAFSVAGLRQGLKDPRGQLTRTYVEICDAIDTVRAAAGKPPVILVWENVPGVLSDRDNAFGNFLGALSGEDGPLEPPGGKWTNAGLVCGPARDLAWRVLDAQYFGVAQRRRRVFLVGHSRAGSLRPVKVLLVEQGVQRHSPPSREAGQRAAPTLAARTRGGGGLGTDFDLDGGLVRHDGGRGGVATQGVAHVVAPPPTEYPELPDTAWCLQHRDAKGPDSDTKPGHILPVAFVAPAIGTFTRSEVTSTLMKHNGAGSGETQNAAYVLQPISDGAHMGGGLNGQDAYTGRVLPVAFTGDGVTADPISAHEGSTYTHEGSTFRLHNCVGVDTYNGTLTGDVAVPLSTMGGAGNTGPSVLAQTMAVRRLTPVECERLQGFPDEYTRIPWKRKPADECPDGPRYKALGNSMAVPCMMWIGKQVQKALV